MPALTCQHLTGSSTVTHSRTQDPPLRVLPQWLVVTSSSVAMSQSVTSCHTLSNPVTSRHSLSHPVTVCHILSQHVISCVSDIEGIILSIHPILCFIGFNNKLFDIINNNHVSQSTYEFSIASIAATHAGTYSVTATYANLGTSGSLEINTKVLGKKLIKLWLNEFSS